MSVGRHYARNRLQRGARGSSSVTSANHKVPVDTEPVAARSEANSTLSKMREDGERSRGWSRIRPEHPTWTLPRTETWRLSLPHGKTHTQICDAFLKSLCGKQRVEKLRGAGESCLAVSRGFSGDARLGSELVAGLVARHREADDERDVDHEHKKH